MVNENQVQNTIWARWHIFGNFTQWLKKPCIWTILNFIKNMIFGISRLKGERKSSSKHYLSEMAHFWKFRTVAQKTIGEDFQSPRQSFSCYLFTFVAVEDQWKIFKDRSMNFVHFLHFLHFFHFLRFLQFLYGRGNLLIIIRFKFENESFEMFEYFFLFLLCLSCDLQINSSKNPLSHFVEMETLIAFRSLCNIGDDFSLNLN